MEMAYEKENICFGCAGNVVIFTCCWVSDICLPLCKRRFDMKRKNTIEKIRYPYYTRMSEQYNAGLVKPCTSGLFSPRKNKIFHGISLFLLLLIYFLVILLAHVLVQ